KRKRAGSGAPASAGTYGKVSTLLLAHGTCLSPPGPSQSPIIQTRKRMRIVFDARHVRDFGIGTYIRNLLRALLEVDTDNEYVLIGYHESKGDLRALAKLSSRVKVTYY